MPTLVGQITFRLNNGAIFSCDRIVTVAREKVTSMALYKCLNSIIYFNIGETRY